MKKLILLLSIGSISFLIYKTYFIPKSTTIINNHKVPSQTDINNKLQNIENLKLKIDNSAVAVFVPYWKTNQLTLTLNIPKIGNMIIDDNLPIYFGVAVNENGIVSDDAGMKNLPDFLGIFEAKSSAITIRMLNNDSNIQILNNLESQQKIIGSITDFLTRYPFSEVILDLELKSLPTDKVKQQINDFTKALAEAVHRQNLFFSMTIYGDVFYRLRPYDLQSLSEFTDRFYIMAYDFHKSYGTPGANFPLNKSSNFNYSLKQMTTDFLQIVPENKMVVIFGLYGYDWSVDEKRRPLKSASAITLAQIRNKFLNGCTNCVVLRDKSSAETMITYKDDENKFHELWFEDEISISSKITYLKSQNISSFAFWAFGYY